MAERTDTPGAWAYLADAQELLAAHDGRHGEAAAQYQQAAALWQEVEAPYSEAHSRRLRAESLLQTGDPGHRAEAGNELAAAQTICVALGAPLELEAIAVLTTRYRLAPGPAQPTSSQAGLLTRREREVIALIARGYSNRAIAEALVISERTAENHVANILGKLGCISRAQAAAYLIYVAAVSNPQQGGSGAEPPSRRSRLPHLAGSAWPLSTAAHHPCPEPGTQHRVRLCQPHAGHQRPDPGPGVQPGAHESCFVGGCGTARLAELLCARRVQEFVSMVGKPGIDRHRGAALC
jgi:DNA-binding CsgD family transcriptional regulator